MPNSTPAADAQPDQLVPDRQVANELGISLMGIWRWSNDPDLDFPPQIKIRNRNFRSRRQLEEFKQRLLRRAIAGRNRTADQEVA